MEKFVKNYNLSIVLFLFFILSWIGQGYFQYKEFESHQIEHGQEPQMADFVNEFLSATFENWQSEYLQLFSMVVLTAYLVHKGSHESKDTDEEFTARLERIEKKIDRKKQ